MRPTWVQDAFHHTTLLALPVGEVQLVRVLRKWLALQHAHRSVVVISTFQHVAVTSHAKYIADNVVGAAMLCYERKENHEDNDHGHHLSHKLPVALYARKILVKLRLRGVDVADALLNVLVNSSGLFSLLLNHRSQLLEYPLKLADGSLNPFKRTCSALKEEVVAI